MQRAHLPKKWILEKWTNGMILNFMPSLVMSHILNRCPLFSGVEMKMQQKTVRQLNEKRESLNPGVWSRSGLPKLHTHTQLFPSHTRAEIRIS